MIWTLLPGVQVMQDLPKSPADGGLFGAKKKI
mgnify:CR=1 FL=1